MNYACLHDKKEIESFLRKNVSLHLYSIGDLDNFFWPYTIWYGLRDNETIRAIALLYIGHSLPTLLALANDDEIDSMRELITSIQHILPSRFYAHLSPGLESALSDTHGLENHGKHYKMALLPQNLACENDSTGISRLGKQDLAAIQKLYDESYPENWFDPRMLETRQFFGIMEGKRLASIAGIHVYSPQYKVAALGNITTHPELRNKGYGARVTAALCQSLCEEGMHIGLNVKTGNDAAISCYRKIGFEIIAEYNEFMIIHS
ncbi:MAG: GNAT family N-acetyltransferase [Candidatus Riflebacteria bacterium]|nr:GNAT family N-acetyltransferase [Candidatus Riflebacteria bacterium]